ncbi:(Fe-S)-binding protein [Cobetia sp. QF-1]|uniref:(Fe-S)-binding protein n=1 Tax=Cobetia sp. QF-1 TaxID=1969833 RepID=UPI000B5447EA|nr:(Fe-S)-binding protein [Cobetia sp. QF-1]
MNETVLRETVLSVLIFAALALAAIGAVKRIGMWRQGRADATSMSVGELIASLAKIPRRYGVDLHHVVARDRYMANTHVATGGGFVAAALLMVVVYGFGIDSAWLGGLLLLASGAMFGGALFVRRRRLDPPARLSRGPWMRLPKSLLVFSASLFVMSLSLVLPEGVGGMISGGIVGLVLIAGIAWGLWEMVVSMTGGGSRTAGPMKHAFAGALHLAFHRRPARFSTRDSAGIRDSALLPLDLSNPEAPLGVGKPSDFNWRQLLGFDACVQCGRCEAVCPAFAAGQPLNPKKLIQDMVVGMAGGSDAAYAGSPYPGDEPKRAVGQHGGGPQQEIVGASPYARPAGQAASSGPIQIKAAQDASGAKSDSDKLIHEFKVLVEPETLWACTTCRACVEECPMMIEHVDAIVDMRRHMTLEHGATPGKGVEVLDNLIATDNPGGFALEARLHWAADLNLPRIAEVQAAREAARDPRPVEALLWLGDGAFDMRNQRTLRTFVQVLRAAKVDFAILGAEERDSGDVARRLGDEATFQSLAKRNIETLSHYRFARIITCDPHSFHVLGREYAAFGGDYLVNHHTSYMNELLAAGRLNLDGGKLTHLGSVTWHDPCYLGRYNGEFEAPRTLLAALGLEVREMERSGSRSRCCGGGGGAPVTDIPGKQRIPDMRMGDVRETGAEVVAVGCPQCTAMLEGVVAPAGEAEPQVLDLAELMARALVLTGPSSSDPKASMIPQADTEVAA